MSYTIILLHTVLAHNITVVIGWLLRMVMRLDTITFTRRATRLFDHRGRYHPVVNGFPRWVYGTRESGEREKTRTV